MDGALNLSLVSETIFVRTISFLRERITPLLYAGSSVVSVTAQLVSGFLIIKWVTPEDVGLWQSVRLAQAYSLILLLGINNGLSRELPFFLGRGEHVLCEQLARTSLFSTGLASGIVIIIGVSCAIACAGRGAHVLSALLAVTALIALAFFQNNLIVTFRSKDSFRTLTNVQLLEASLSIATVPMVYCFRYYGMLSRAVLISGVTVSLLYAFRPMRVRARLDRQALILLLKTGVPLFGLNYIRDTTATFDRLVLLGVSGAREVGIYAIAGVVLQTLSALPQSLAAYLFPRMAYKFGERGDPRLLWRDGFRFAVIAVLASGFIGAGAWLFLPYAVPALVPKYLEGLKAAQIVLIAGIAEGATIVVNALWSMKAWRLMVAYQVSASILFALGPVVGWLLMRAPLEGVAWGVVGSGVCRVVLAVGLTYYGTHRGMARCGRLTSVSDATRDNR